MKLVSTRRDMRKWGVLGNRLREQCAVLDMFQIGDLVWVQVRSRVFPVNNRVFVALKGDRW